MRQYLEKICEIFNIPNQTPADRVEHRWLSTYDAAVIDAPLLPALAIMYYASTPANYSKIYKYIIDSLLKVSLKTCFFIINISLCYLGCAVVEYVVLCIYYLLYLIPIRAPFIWLFLWKHWIHKIFIQISYPKCI